MCRGGMSRRCLTSPHGGPAGSKNGAAALLGGNGADLLHGAGEPHGGWTELGGAGSRRGAGGGWRRRRRACMRRGAGPQGCLLSTSGFSSQRLYCHQGAGRAPEAARVQGAVAGGRMHCRRRCRAAARPARPAPDRRQWPSSGGTHPAATSRSVAVHASAPPLGGGRRGGGRLVAPLVGSGMEEEWRGGGAGAHELPSKAGPSGMGCSGAGSALTARRRDQGTSHGPSEGRAPAQRPPQRCASSTRPQAPSGSPAPHDGSPPGLRRPRRAWVGVARRAGHGGQAPGRQAVLQGGGWGPGRSGGDRRPLQPAHATLRASAPALRLPPPACRCPSTDVLLQRQGSRGTPCPHPTHPHALHPQVCRCLPWVVDNYRLDELTTVPELRSNLAAMFRKYTDVQVPACLLCCRVM